MSENKKYYILCETDQDGIKQFNAASDDGKAGTTLSRMYVEGKLRPALKLEVDADTHYSFHRDDWAHESRLKYENRCTITGDNGTSRTCPMRIPNPDYTGKPGELKTLPVDCASCPHNQSDILKPGRKVIHFSDLAQPDAEGYISEWEPESPSANIYADEYSDLLFGFVAYIREHHPKEAKYAEAIEIIGTGYTVKDAARKLGVHVVTIYDHLKKLRPIYDEYKDSIIAP